MGHRAGNEPGPSIRRGNLLLLVVVVVRLLLELGQDPVRVLERPVREDHEVLPVELVERTSVGKPRRSGKQRYGLREFDPPGQVSISNFR